MRAMTQADENINDYFLVPEEAIEHLPQEWREAIYARAEDGRKVLKAAEPELRQVSRLSLSYYHLTVLKHVRDRLAEYRFQADMIAFLELEMLTTAFVAAYVRLFTGGSGSGFARDALPQSLRPAHDEIIELRNKRYAHVADHHSVSDEMEIYEEDGRFVVTMGLRFGFYVGGSNDWTKLVDALDEMFAERGERLVERLRVRTGREWGFAQGVPSASVKDDDRF